MDVASLSPASVAASRAADVQSDAGILALRKAMDVATSEGAQLVQLINQSAGLGRTIDTTA